jgi:threonine synthase
MDRDADLCRKAYASFPSQPIHLDKSIWEKSKNLFLSYTVNDGDTFNAMQKTYKKYNYLIDPHTAVASEAIDALSELNDNKSVILSTAHPAKFPNTIKESNLEIENIPTSLSEIYNLEEEVFHFPASKELIFDFIIKHNQ